MFKRRASAVIPVLGGSTGIGAFEHMFNHGLWRDKLHVVFNWSKRYGDRVVVVFCFGVDSLLDAVIDESDEACGDYDT